MREKQQRFLRLYEPVQPTLTRYLRYKIADPQNGEDVLQEVLAALFIFSIMKKLEKVA